MSPQAPAAARARAAHLYFLRLAPSPFLGACRLSSAASELEKRAEEGKAGADAGASCRSLVREVCDAFKAVERHELLHKEAGAGAGGAAASWREAAVGAKPPARPEEWSGRASPGGSGGAHAAPSRLAAAGGVEGGSTRTGELEQVVSMLLSAKRQTLDEARLVAAEPHNQERLRSLARAAELYHTASLSAAIGADLLIANARHLRHILRAVRDEPRTGRRVEAAAVEEAALTAMAALRSDVSVELPKVCSRSVRLTHLLARRTGPHAHTHAAHYWLGSRHEALCRRRITGSGLLDTYSATS